MVSVGRRSRWTRFFTVLGSGTGWKNNPAERPVGSSTNEPSGSLSAKRSPVALAQNVAARTGAEQSKVSVSGVSPTDSYAPVEALADSTSATASSKISSAARAWSSRNTSGGDIRIASSPQDSTSRPLRNDAISTAAA